MAALSGSMIHFLLQVSTQEPWRQSGCHQFYSIAHPASLDIASLPHLMYLLLDFGPLVTAPPKVQYSRVKNQSTLGKLFFLGELYIGKGG